MNEQVVETAPARPDDGASIAGLLEQAGLPADELGDAQVWIARSAGVIVGCIAMQQRGHDALFRSLVVAPPWRGRSIGRRLHEALTDYARESGVRTVFLFTHTIEGLARDWGYEAISRDALPPAIAGTWEARASCCAGAVVMRRHL